MGKFSSCFILFLSFSVVRAMEPGEAARRSERREANAQKFSRSASDKSGSSSATEKWTAQNFSPSTLPLRKGTTRGQGAGKLTRGGVKAARTKGTENQDEMFCKYGQMYTDQLMACLTLTDHSSRLFEVVAQGRLSRLPSLCRSYSAYQSHLLQPLADVSVNDLSKKIIENLELKKECVAKLVHEDYHVPDSIVTLCEDYKKYKDELDELKGELKDELKDEDEIEGEVADELQLQNRKESLIAKQEAKTDKLLENGRASIEEWLRKIEALPLEDALGMK